MSKGKILVVEDEFVTGAEIQAHLQDMGYDVPAIVDTGEEAVAKTGELQPDAVVMDITLKGSMNGIEAAGLIRARFGTPVIYLTAHSDDATVTQAIQAEPFGYLVKPLDERALMTTIRMALYKHAMDERLRQSEETVRGLLNATNDETVLVDKQGTILAFNDAFARSAGMPADKLANTVIYELIKTGGISLKTADEMQKTESPAPVSFEEEAGDRWFETTIYTLRDTRGDRKQVAIFRHDISTLKRAERELAAANDQLEKEKSRLALFASALDNMSDCAIITDGIGTVVWVNVTFEKRFSFTRDQMMGKHIGELAHAENRYPLSKEEFLHYLDTDNTAAFVAKNAYGVRMPMTLKSKPIVLENNRPRNFIFVLRDAMG